MTHLKRQNEVSMPKKISKICGLGAIFICDSKIREEFDKIEKQNNDRTNAANNEVGKIVNEMTSSLLGFTPTIKNIIDIVLAHLDVGMNLLNSRIEEIYGDETRQNAAAYNLTAENSDILTNRSEKTMVPPFFTYYENTKDPKGINTTETIDKRQEAWIGKNQYLKKLTEVNIVKDYLNGITEITPEAVDFRDKITNAYTNGTPDLWYLLPTDVLHYTEGENPYGGILSGSENEAELLVSLKTMFLYRLFVYEYFIRKEQNRGRYGGTSYQCTKGNIGEKIANIEATAFMKTAAFRDMGETEIKILEKAKTKFLDNLNKKTFFSTTNKYLVKYNLPSLLPTPKNLLDITEREIKKNQLSIILTGRTINDDTQFILNTEDNQGDFSEIATAVKTRYGSAVEYGYFNRNLNEKKENDGFAIWKKYYNNKYIFRNSSETVLTKSNFVLVNQLFDGKINVNKNDDALSAISKCGFKKYEFAQIDDSLYIPFFAVTREQSLYGSELLKNNTGATKNNCAAYLFLNALPLNYMVLVKRLIKTTISPTKPIIASVPKALVLLTGALLWRKTVAGTADDVSWVKGYKAPAPGQMPRGETDPFMLLIKAGAQEEYQNFDDSWMTDGIKSQFITAFLNWCGETEGEWSTIYKAYFSNSADAYKMRAEKNKKIYINNNKAEAMTYVSNILTTEWTLNILHPVGFLDNTSEVHFSNGSQKEYVPFISVESVENLWGGFVNKVVSKKKEIERQNKLNEELFNDVLKEHEELIRMENKEKELEEKNKKKEEKNWNNIVNKMEKRDHTCAICLCEFNNKSLYVLDCTHCFHKNCLDSFERFDPYYIKRCPICRASYTKKEIKMENDGKFKENKNKENNYDFNKNNKNMNINKGKPFINKEHPLYEQYKQFIYLDDYS